MFGPQALARWSDSSVLTMEYAFLSTGAMSHLVWTSSVAFAPISEESWLASTTLICWPHPRWNNLVYMPVVHGGETYWMWPGDTVYPCIGVIFELERQLSYWCWCGMARRSHPIVATALVQFFYIWILRRWFPVLWPVAGPNVGARCSSRLLVWCFVTAIVTALLILSLLGPSARRSPTLHIEAQRKLTGPLCVDFLAGSHKSFGEGRVYALVEMFVPTEAGCQRGVR